MHNLWIENKYYQEYKWYEKSWLSNEDNEMWAKGMSKKDKGNAPEQRPSKPKYLTCQAKCCKDIKRTNIKRILFCVA